MSSNDRIPILQLILLGLVASSCITPILAQSLQQNQQEGRKFVSKPNDIKKIRYNIEKQQKQNEIIESSQPGFQWGNLAGMAMKLLVGGPKNGDGPKDKADTITQLTWLLSLQNGEFTWTKMVSLMLEIVLSVMGGGDNNKIDRTDSSLSPLENIMSTVISFLFGTQDRSEVNVLARQASQVMQHLLSLLETLRMSFSQRSMEARSLGTSDPVADVVIATASMARGYLRTYNTLDDLCIQKYLCEANHDCVEGASDSGYLFCQIGTYGLSYALEGSTYTPFEIYSDAGRRGRVGETCGQIFAECNDI